MPKTMTRIEGVEPTASGNIVVTVLGGEKVGTTDKALGEDAMLAFHDKGHDMWEIEFEQRNGKLYLLAFEPVIAPPELGGPADGAGTTPEAAEAASGSAVSPDSPEKGSAPDFSLDELLKLADRVRHIEEFLTRNMEFEA